MMKLILSLALLWMLCSTGSPGQQQSKSCVSSSICNPNNQTFSFNFGSYNLTASVHCYQTNSCNSVNLTYPAHQKENDLKCFTCDKCNDTVSCVEHQDRCIRGTVAMKNSIKKVFGCASKNLCDASSKLQFLTDYLNFTSGPQCCDSSLCNSALTVKLSVAPFLLGLIMLAAC